MASSLLGSRMMSCELARHLEECRRKGLSVDEDFERGVGRLRHYANTAALVGLAAVLALLLAAIARPRVAATPLAPAITAPSNPREPTTRSRAPFRRAIVFERLRRANA